MADEYKGFAKPVSIMGIIFIIIGVILMVVGIVGLIAESGDKPWWVWFTLIGGIVLAIVGAIILTIDRNKYKKEKKKTTVVVTPPSSHTDLVRTPATHTLAQHGNHTDVITRPGTTQAVQHVTPGHVDVMTKNNNGMVPAGQVVHSVNPMSSNMMSSSTQVVHTGIPHTTMHTDVVRTPGATTVTPHNGHYDVNRVPGTTAVIQHPSTHMDMVTHNMSYRKSGTTFTTPGSVAMQPHVHTIQSNGMTREIAHSGSNSAPVVTRTVYPGTSYTK